MKERLSKSLVAKVFYHKSSIGRSYWLLCAKTYHFKFEYYKIIAVLSHIEDFTTIKTAKSSVKGK